MCLPFLLLPFIFFTQLPVTVPSTIHPRYYAKTCPNAELIVRDVMQKAMIREPRSGASVMRLQFHDCFVNVRIYGSLLLDDTPTMLGEKLSLSNINSLRSYEVVDEIKEALETACPQIVSCADIIIMASRDAVALSGGPDWEVKLGRKDSLTASQKDSDDIMPSPRANASTLIDLFAKLYNQTDDGRPDPSIEPRYRQKLDKLCPLGGDEEVIGDLDFTPRVFDNQYFKDLVNGRGFLNSDETLYTFWQTRGYVQRYSDNQSAFFKDFVEGMIKMGDLQSGRPGEVRSHCRVVNDVPPVEIVMRGSKDRKILSF
ncbi:peroxidase 17 [Tanacetum coccineum]